MAKPLQFPAEHPDLFNITFNVLSLEFSLSMFIEISHGKKYEKKL